jgi:hypothetical protein
MLKIDLNMGVECNTLITESKYKKFVKLHGDVPCLKCIVRPTCFDEHNFGENDFKLKLTVPINDYETTAIIPYNELLLQYPYEPCLEYYEWLDMLQNFSLEKYRCFVTGTKISD